MKSKQLIYLLCAAVVLLLVVLAIGRARRRAWESGTTAAGGLILPDFPVNDVKQIIITGADGTVNIVKRDEMWRVAERHDYPARFDKIGEFLRDLLELRATQTLNVGESQYGRLDLLPPEPSASNAGTHVDFLDREGKKIASLILGKEHMRKATDSQPGMMGMMGGGSWPDGRYLLVPETKRVALVSKTFSSIDTKPDNWLDKEFFKIGDMQRATLKEGDKELWSVARDDKNADMKLIGPVDDGYEPDASKLSSIKNAFSWASFTDVADPEATPEQTGMDNPKMFTANDVDGFVYTVLIGNTTDDGKRYVKVDVDYTGSDRRDVQEDEQPEDAARKDKEWEEKQRENRRKAADLRKRLAGWTYVISNYTVDSVLKEREDLLKEKPKPVEEKDEEKAEAAAADAADSANVEQVDADGGQAATPPDPPASPAD